MFWRFIRGSYVHGVLGRRWVYGRQIVSGAWKRLCLTIFVSVNQM